MTKDMNPHELGAFGAYAAEAIANQIADDRDHWKARAGRAEAEAAELRAERDAARAGQGWRPGSTTPPATDWYWVYDFMEDDVPLRRYYNGAGWGFQGDEEAPDWFMPIPPLPAAPDADAGEE